MACSPYRVRPHQVKDAFSANFEKHGEVGAAFCLYHRGKKVVDLWGGVADVDSGRLWTEDSIAVVFSSTKGATAICAHLLAQRGELDLDAPVARYWPEFDAGGSLGFADPQAPSRHRFRLRDEQDAAGRG